MRRKAEIAPLAVHGLPHQLASAVPALYDRSVKAFIDELERCDQLGAEYLVAHVGVRGRDEEDGMPCGKGAQGVRNRPVQNNDSTGKHARDGGYRIQD